MSDIKTEILQAISKHNLSDQEKSRVEEELQIMESNSDLENENSLSKFYNIWKTENKGNRNEINSFCAFFLGMTTKKPDIDSQFMPERRAYARSGFPDIDVDFDDAKRYKVFNYLREKYGDERFAHIGTYQSLKMKAAIRRIGKATDVADAFYKGKKEYVTENEEKVTEIIKSLPPQKGAVLKVYDEEGNQKTIKTVEDAYNHCDDFRRYMEKYPQIREHAKYIEGLLSSKSCLSGDTPVLTKNGWFRIDQLDPKINAVAYLDQNKEMRFSKKYDAIHNGKKITYRMKLSNGDFIDVTDEHLIFTDKGVVRFEEIRKNKEKYKIMNIRKDIIDFS
jgi:hypothetical protein